MHCHYRNCHYKRILLHIYLHIYVHITRKCQKIARNDNIIIIHNNNIHSVAYPASHFLTQSSTPNNPANKANNAKARKIKEERKERNVTHRQHSCDKK